MEKHEVVKARHETRRRRITVTAVSALTPRMRRVEFASEELHDFNSPSADDHIKIFLPVEGAEAAMRDFTPRAFDPACGTLVIDFALHESGPATSWARNAGPGDVLEIGGPRGSLVVPDDFDWYLMVGDAAAIPSFGRRLEGLRAGVAVTTVIAIEDVSERQEFVTEAHWTARWVVREAGATLQDALQDYALPAGDGFVWIAAEAAESRSLYRLVVEEMGHPAAWTKASAYWTREEASQD